MTTVLIPTRDHTKLRNIGTNTHAQIDVALDAKIPFTGMAGNALYGNSTSGGNLTLTSTSHATKGLITAGPLTINEETDGVGIGIAQGGDDDYALVLKGRNSALQTFTVPGGDTNTFNRIIQFTDFPETKAIGFFNASSDRLRIQSALAFGLDLYAGGQKDLRLQVFGASDILTAVTVKGITGNVLIGSITDHAGEKLQVTGDVYLYKSTAGDVLQIKYHSGTDASKGAITVYNENNLRTFSIGQYIGYTEGHIYLEGPVGQNAGSLIQMTHNGKSGIFQYSSGSLIFRNQSIGDIFFDISEDIGAIYFRTGVSLVTKMTIANNGNITMIGALTTNGGIQTFGANDSAGAGYRYVRVPNV